MLAVGDYVECISASHRGSRGYIVSFTPFRKSVRVDTTGDGKVDFVVHYASVKRRHAPVRAPSLAKATPVLRKETLLWAVACQLQETDEWMTKDEWQKVLADALEKALVL